MALTIQDPSTFNPNPFDKLPIEITQQIASSIEYDSDICNFRLISHSTHDAVDADGCSFWRRRFLAHFEMPPRGNWSGPQANESLKRAYQRRKKLLKIGTVFVDGHSRKEQWCLDVVKEMINDAFSGNKDPAVVYESANLNFVKRFVIANNLLRIFEPPKPNRSSVRRRGAPSRKPSESLRVVQIMCAPMLLSFEPSLLHEHYGFPDSQRVVYSSVKRRPIFPDSNEVSMSYVLHNINFWKYHLLRQVEGTLFSPFSDLDPEDRPRWWSQPVERGMQILGKHWKGSYAFIETDEIELLRSGQADGEQIQDVFAGEDDGCAFQDMCLNFTDDDSDFLWPDEFEKHLRSLTVARVPILTRAQRRRVEPRSEQQGSLRPQAFQFSGNGKDAKENFLAAGWLNPLPDQNGIVGWQRLTMTKYFKDSGGAIDMHGLWAYEGVVLPGGQIIVGRWWSPRGPVDDDDAYSGPFILWCVDGPKYAAQDEVERAVAAEGHDGLWKWP